jgi:hypothetical protein
VRATSKNNSRLQNAGRSESDSLTFSINNTVIQMKEKLRPSKTAEQNFSIDQVAAKLCVGRSTVERLLYSGKLGFTK